MPVRVENNLDYASDDIPKVPTYDSVLKAYGYGAEYYGKWHTPYQFADCYDNNMKVVGKIPGAPGQIASYQKWLESKGVMPKEPG